MELTAAFLNLVQQQLKSFDGESAIKILVVYVAQTKNDQAPTLEVVGQWPVSDNSLLPIEADSELRAPSPYRRWYPLQNEKMLLGALRVECFHSEAAWPDLLDMRLRACASALAQCLGLELDRKRLADELIRQREQVSLMVHQLRNPLAALRTYAQLLLRRIEPNSAHRTLVEGLIAEQDQLNRYISVLDNFSEGKLPSSNVIAAPLLLPPVLPKTSSVIVRSLLEPLLDRAAANADLQGRKWYGPVDWPDWVDEEKSAEYGVIAEIVANLLENAFRYSSFSSSIGLHITSEGLCVWDSGDPIPSDEREKIFEKGYRGRSVKESSGSGIGLALAVQLAAQLDCKLQLVKSPVDFAPNLPLVGNAFVLRLP